MWRLGFGVSTSIVICHLEASSEVTVRDDFSCHVFHKLCWFGVETNFYIHAYIPTYIPRWGGGGHLCSQPTWMFEYESDGHGSVLGSN